MNGNIKDNTCILQFLYYFLFLIQSDPYITCLFVLARMEKWPSPEICRIFI